VRQLWQSSPSEQLAATQTVPAYAGTAESSTMFGFEQSVGNATLDTGYAVDHTVNGTDLYDAIGVRQRFQPSQYLTGDAFGQVGQQLLATVVPTSGPSTPYFFVLGGSLNYARQAFHATTQVQVRTGFDGGSTFQVGATGPINNDISLFGGYNRLVHLGGLRFQYSGRALAAALAQRPVRDAALVDTQKSNLTSYDAYITNVAQLQQLYRPSTRTEFAASVAYKIQATRTSRQHHHLRHSRRPADRAALRHRVGVPPEQHRADQRHQRDGVCGGGGLPDRRSVARGHGVQLLGFRGSVTRESDASGHLLHAEQLRGPHLWVG